MTTFVTVLQTSATTFEVRYFDGETSTRLYPQYRDMGVAVAIWEATDRHVEYCKRLAEDLRNGK